MITAISEARRKLSLPALGRDRDCRVERLSLGARIRSLSATPRVAFRFTLRRSCSHSHDFSQGAHGLSKNLCADARSLAGDYGKRKTKRTFIFGLTLRPYLLAGGMRSVDRLGLA